jgi:hypothetical protein
MYRLLDVPTTGGWEHLGREVWVGELGELGGGGELAPVATRVKQKRHLINLYVCTFLEKNYLQQHCFYGKMLNKV